MKDLLGSIVTGAESLINRANLFGVGDLCGARPFLALADREPRGSYVDDHVCEVSEALGENLCEARLSREDLSEDLAHLITDCAARGRCPRGSPGANELFLSWHQRDWEHQGSNTLRLHFIALSRILVKQPGTIREDLTSDPRPRVPAFRGRLNVRPPRFATRAGPLHERSKHEFRVFEMDKLLGYRESAAGCYFNDRALWARGGQGSRHLCLFCQRRRAHGRLQILEKCI